MDKSSLKEIIVRDVSMNLNVSNRSLELCSRMNYEVENLDFIDMCQVGDVFFDIGACEGRFGIYAAHKGLNVYAFEPEGNNYDMLCQNIENNDLSNISPYNVGVSDTNGTATMNIGQPWAGGHQKVIDYGEKREDLDFDFKETQTINIVRLDDFISENNIPIPKWLKVDVDGSELPFIRGAKGTLSNPDVRGILFELNMQDTSFEGIVSLLNQFGWKENSRHQVPNEPNLYNFWFVR